MICKSFDKIWQKTKLYQLCLEKNELEDKNVDKVIVSLHLSTESMNQTKKYQNNYQKHIGNKSFSKVTLPIC